MLTGQGFSSKDGAKVTEWRPAWGHEAQALTARLVVVRQEPQGSSPGFECARSDSDRRVPAELGQESQASSCVEEWNSA